MSRREVALDQLFLFSRSAGVANEDSDKAVMDKVKPDSQTSKVDAKPAKSTDPEDRVKTPKGDTKGEKPTKQEGGPAATPRGQAKQDRTAKSSRKGGKSKRQAKGGADRGVAGRRPGPKPYPVITFEQALKFAQGVAEVGQGHPVKRTTLLEKLGLPVSQATKDLITASGKYGLTIGGHSAEELRLTPDGAKAVAGTPSPEQTNARVKLAIQDIPAFNRLYEKFRGGKMPAVEVMRDYLDDMNEGDRSPCVDLFVQNAKFVGLLQLREGAEFITTPGEAVSPAASASSAGATTSNQPIVGEDFDSVCFFIAPIGGDDSPHRRHSDAILSSYVEKALASVEPKLRVVRADKIAKPGSISKQVLEYLLKSRLVVADLSYHNPNVFYELAVRHATGKPVVHIKRTTDPIPFDNKDFRTIDIKFEDKFDILAEIESVRSMISQFSRETLSTGESSDNPLLMYFPDHRFAKVTK